MEIITNHIEGLLLIKPKVFNDARGYFLETWQSERYAQMGIDLPFVQDNHSRSTYGVLRGLHYQKTRPQGKLVSVSLGSIYDVAVDIRPHSKTYGQWQGVHLSQDNHHQFWIAPGFAHGFIVTSEYAHVHYKATDFYCPADEGCILWNSPELNIDWTIKNPIISDKDSQGKPFNMSSNICK